MAGHRYAENYLKLLKAIDRPQFGAHIDAVNMVISPRLYFNSGRMIREGFALLGPWIVSCHAKDIVMQGGPGNISFHMDEVVPGDGNLDYGAYLTEIDKLGRDVPLMLEHFDQPGYRRGLAYIKTVASEAGVATYIEKPLAIDLQGSSGFAYDAHGFVKDNWTNSWINAPTGRIAGGADEMLLNTIAEKILGLPQDHRPDKGVPFNQIPA